MKPTAAAITTNKTTAWATTSMNAVSVAATVATARKSLQGRDTLAYRPIVGSLEAHGPRCHAGIRHPADQGNYSRVMAAPPTLTPDQRMAALAKAAEARRVRAELKEKLKMGSVSLSELLRMAETDEIVGKTKVLAVLESLPGVGKVKARRLMEEVGISETRRIRGLGGQQRAALLVAVGS